MNKRAKVLIVTGIILMALGFCLSLFSFKKIVKSFYYNDESEYNKKELVLKDEITELNINSKDEKVIIKNTTEDKIKIIYYENKYTNFEVNENGNSFSLKRKIKSQIFSWNVNFFQPSVIVEIPNDNNINLKITANGASINASNINIKNGNFESKDGKITLNKVVADNLVLNASSYNMNLTDIEVSNKIDASNRNGKIVFDNVVSDYINSVSSSSNIVINNTTANEKLLVKTNDEKIRFSNIFSKDIELITKNEKIEGTINGDEKDFKREISTTNEEIKINEIKYGKLVNDRNGLYRLYIKTTNSKINIDFK